jgi:3-oxoacyl-[acyl-carrier protein] reductase
VVASIVEANGKAFAFKADVASADETKNTIDEVKKALGKIDILVNNAGVWEGGPVAEIDVEQFDRIFSVNVRGVIATTLAALKVLSPGGRIINISSGVATVTIPGMSVYSASKAALDALTRVWAQDLGARGITVNSVSPGTTLTDMFDKAMPGEEIKEQVISKTALGRLGQPEDIASVVAFLAGKDGGWVTGQAIRADGGINI